MQTAPARAPLLPRLMSQGGRGAGDKVLGVDQTARRTWDKEVWAKKEEERELAERDAEAEEELRRKNRQVVARKNLQLTGNRAEGRLDLAAHVGKTMVVEGADGAKSKQGVWYCPDCDVLLHDSGAYLDHINGKKHQRVLGMNMRVERSTLPQVQAKLVPGRRLQRPKEKSGRSREDADREFEERIQEQLDKEQVAAEARREKRKAKRQEAAAAKQAEAEEGIDAETRAMAEAMGLPMSFGGGS